MDGKLGFTKSNIISALVKVFLLFLATEKIENKTNEKENKLRHVSVLSSLHPIMVVTSAFIMYMY